MCEVIRFGIAEYSHPGPVSTCVRTRGDVYAMPPVQSKLTAQGQIFVPVEMRKKLGVGRVEDASEWDERNNLSAYLPLLAARLRPPSLGAAAAADEPDGVPAAPAEFAAAARGARGGYVWRGVPSSRVTQAVR